MGRCNGQFSLCQSSCIARRPPSGILVTDPTLSRGQVSATGSCIAFCTNEQLACQIVCARDAPSR
jgi:hypothetical protein